MTIEKFIENAINIHGNLYDYSNANYINTNTKIDIICNKYNHGLFKQTPNMHVNSQNRCPKCVGGIKFTLSEFIEKSNKIHNNCYEYSKAIYINNKTKIEIICNKHGSFWQLAKNHLRGIGCAKCSGKYSGNSEYFIKRANLIHDNLYNYDRVDYIKTNNKVDIICNNHGLFKQTPHDHLHGHGCQKCTHTVSKTEISWLNSLKVPHEFRNKTIKLNNKLFKPDAVDINNKIIWEFYGDFWHGNPQKYNSKDINCKNKKSFGALYNATSEKENILANNGYKIISIWESEWNKKMEHHV